MSVAIYKTKKIGRYTQSDKHLYTVKPWLTTTICAVKFWHYTGVIKKIKEEINFRAWRLQNIASKNNVAHHSCQGASNVSWTAFRSSSNIKHKEDITSQSNSFHLY